MWDGVEEITDQTSAFVLGELGQPVYEFRLLRCGPSLGHRHQHREPQTQDADLHCQFFSVSLGDLEKRELAVYDLADRGGPVPARAGSPRGTGLR